MSSSSMCSLLFARGLVPLGNLSWNLVRRVQSSPVGTAPSGFLGELPLCLVCSWTFLFLYFWTSHPSPQSPVYFPVCTKPHTCLVAGFSVCFGAGNQVPPSFYLGLSWVFVCCRLFSKLQYARLLLFRSTGSTGCMTHHLQWLVSGHRL